MGDVVNVVERHPGIALLFVVLAMLFAESIIGTERMERRIEAVQLPPYANEPLRGDE